MDTTTQNQAQSKRFESVLFDTNHFERAKTKAYALESEFDLLAYQSQELVTAYQKLEEAIMWFGKALKMEQEYKQQKG